MHLRWQETSSPLTPVKRGLVRSDSRDGYELRGGQPSIYRSTDLLHGQFADLGRGGILLAHAGGKQMRELCEIVVAMDATPGRQLPRDICLHQVLAFLPLEATCETLQEVC